MGHVVSIFLGIILRGLDYNWVKLRLISQYSYFRLIKVNVYEKGDASLPYNVRVLKFWIL